MLKHSVHVTSGGGKSTLGLTTSLTHTYIPHIRHQPLETIAYGIGGTRNGIGFEMRHIRLIGDEQSTLAHFSLNETHRVPHTATHLAPAAVLRRILGAVVLTTSEALLFGIEINARQGVAQEARKPQNLPGRAVCQTSLVGSTASAVVNEVTA